MSAAVPDFMALAELQAGKDRDTLARLMVAGRVQREGPGNRRFVEDITARVNVITGHRPVNLAIRPKKRKGKR